MRRIAKGELAELFGEMVIPIDKLMTAARIRSTAIETVPTLSPEVAALLQSYADGINDYVSGVSLGSAEGSARLLPPEFYAFGIEWQPWTVADSVAAMRLMNI